MEKAKERKWLKGLNGIVLIGRKEAGSEVIVEGYEDIENKIPHSVHSQFLICSISKTFVAVAINQLCEKGLLNKHDLLSKYVPDYFKGQEVTLYQLLTHTSGIPNFTMFRKEIEWTRGITAESLLRTMESKGMKFEPSTKWNYTNTGYYLLALVVEKVSGMKYEEYVQKYIFNIAQMTQSSFVTRKNNKVVKSHIKNKYAYDFHPSLLFGAGDVVSTAKDLYEFGKALMEGKLVSKETLNEMSTPVFPGQKAEYGEGLFINQHFGTLEIGHSGSIPAGYSSQLSIYPEQGTVIVVLTNNRKIINPLVYPDANGKYIAGCLAEEVFGQKIGIMKKVYM